jgi:hypothetical protein
MNDNVRIEGKLERLRDYLRQWAICDARWSPVKGFPREIGYLVDNMKAGVADSSEMRDGPNPWAMSVVDTQLGNLSLRIPEARVVLLARYLNKGAAVYRFHRISRLDQYAVDVLADRVELELMPMVEREGLPL